MVRIVGWDVYFAFKFMAQLVDVVLGQYYVQWVGHGVLAFFDLILHRLGKRARRTSCILDRDH